MLQLGHWVRSLPSQADAGLSLCSAPQGPGCPASALPPPQIHVIAGETEAQPWCSQGWAWVWARPSGLPKENGLGSPPKRHQLPGIMASNCPRPASQDRGALGVAQRYRLGRRWGGEPLYLFCPWTPEAPVPVYSPGRGLQSGGGEQPGPRTLTPPTRGVRDMWREPRTARR